MELKKKYKKQNPQLTFFGRYKNDNIENLLNRTTH